MKLAATALAAALALTSGAAYAMDCCKDGKCCCEKMMKQPKGQGDSPAPAQPHDPSQHR
ncbi:MAG TPA: hypothetical protein VF559_03150 [Caulobacteraceae bacterium]|jgi:hypothetical protein